MNLEPVIGLEIHVQLKTKSKMFCGCSNRGEYEPPNTTICSVCTGQPGVLPVINMEAVKMGVLAALSLNCQINKISKFDRKQYFYPDLPKGYQISQYDKPVAEHGYLDIDIPAQEKDREAARIGITRLHLEEDAAKNTHSADKSYTTVDYNRGGTPLAEIVSEPDIKSPLEAKIFLQELRKIMRYLNVSDADMEKGQLRCDANVSLREYIEDAQKPAKWAPQLNPKTEIKNLNSFNAVFHALEYEIKRQTALWEEGKPPSVQSTRGWDDAKGVTYEQRTKEEAHDYRYFPEPDLPPMNLAELAGQMKKMIPEMPRARKFRFTEEYGFSPADAEILTEDPYKSDYIERAVSELVSWLMSMENIEGTETEIWQKYGKKLSKLVSGWFINKLGGLMTERKVDIRTLKITPENFAEFITIVYENKISGTNGLKLLEVMMEAGGDPSQIMEEKDLGTSGDSGELQKIVEKVINSNEKAVADYRAGKEATIMFLVGQVMKEAKGKANPTVAKELLIKKITAY